MNNRRWVCNPLSTAELIGREYLEATIQRPSTNIDNLFYNIKRINQRAYSIDDSVQEIQSIHGEWSGVDTELVSFAKNLFGNDAGFRQGILELENILAEAQGVRDNINSIISVANNLSFQDVSTTVLRAYLDSVHILLPQGVKKELQNNLETMPFFSEMSEALGSVYADFIVDDKMTNIIDGIIGNILDETGLSSVVSKESWLGMLPEYAINFHDNIRLFQRLGTRVMPNCTYGKIYNVMDEPLAHIYNFAQDAYFFSDLLANRKVVISNIVNKYRNMIKKLNNFFPICAEISVDNIPQNTGYGIPTDMNGNVVQEVSVDRSSPIVVEYQK